MFVFFATGFRATPSCLPNYIPFIFDIHVLLNVLFQVDEEGTTAAAATHFQVRTKARPSMILEPKLFIADHPFIFILTKDHNPLFIGQFA
ncbi:unnamed protein product [Strongylus vulgaris]|uniref:Serpin domain-containing protein n=1 Tax=Strongylus vulgaris TaxID=40348 RepID=A0A3P7J9C6_STRVU|nr:unnamed protein product [Strongylus vulgaris]